MQNGFPVNWRECIISLAWTSAPVTWKIMIMNVWTSWQAHYHRGWNLDSSIQTWEQTTEHAVETHNFSCFQEILIMAFSSQDYANSVLGFRRPSMWTLSTSTAHIWDHSSKSWVFGHCNQQIAHNRKEEIESAIVTWKCITSNCCPYNNNPSNMELDTSWPPSLYSSPDFFQLPPVWTLAGGNESITKSRWWDGDSA